MLEEQSGQHNDYVHVPAAEPLPNPHQKRLSKIYDVVSQVLSIQITHPAQSDVELVAYEGALLVDSDEVIDTLDESFAKLGVHAYFREHEVKPDTYLIRIMGGRFDPEPRSWIINAVLFALTVLSLFWVGAGIQAGLDNPGATNFEDLDIQLWKGWQYAVGLMLILGAHELGHYFAGRYHKVAVTLPYFIPLPFGFGTLGAFIQLREPMKSRNILFDIGVAGPLAGLFFAIPILFLGLATSEIHPIPENVIFEGNSLFYAGAKILVFGRFVPDGTDDVFINQFAQAGWTGLFVTMLNLIPVGQLDGGHVMYSLFGKYARKLYMPIVGTLAMLTVLVNPAWGLWTVILLFLGRTYAIPLDDVTPLSNRRRFVGYLAVVVFILLFIPDPLRQG